jgi:hypothetical protein
MVQKYYPTYYTEEEIKKNIEKQKITLWVNSYGGSGTNWLRKNLMQKYNISTPIWRKKMCHYIKPIGNLDIKYAFYIYGDPLYASISELRRGNKNMSFFEMNFYKMMPIEDKNLIYSYPLMMEKMIEQMNNWKNANVNYPVVLIKYEKIGEHISEIENLLSLQFKIPYQSRKTDQKMINFFTKKYNLSEYSESIKKTREVYDSMPDFKIIYPGK